MLKIKSPLVISVGSSAPITVASGILCPGLNSQYLNGMQSTDFAPYVHTHVASDITNGVLAGERVGSGSLVGIKALFSGGSPGSGSSWRAIQTSDLSGVTDFMVDYVLPAMDASQARAAIEAAPSVHVHNAADVTSGIFSVDRVGSGGTTSAAKVLFGSNVSGGAGQWRTPGFADITGAVGFSGSPTTGRIPYWTSPGVLGNSPFNCVGDPVSSVTTDADFGTNGSVTCADLVLDASDSGAAVSFRSSVFTRVNSIIQGSPSISITRNPGDQTLTLDIASGYSTVLGNTGAVTVPDTELAETTLIGTIRSGESATFGAGTLPTGSIIKVEAMGTVSAPGNWANGVLRVKFGSSRALAFTLLEEDSHLASGYAWRLTAWLSVTTAGASATTVLSGMLEYEYPSDADTPGVRRLRHLTGTASGTLDTTASNTFNLTWDNATGLEVNWTCNHLLVTRY